jgi:hypothetical protein
MIADRGMARYDYALQTLKDVPYGKWRESDPESAVCLQREVFIKNYVRGTPMSVRFAPVGTAPLERSLRPLWVEAV